MIQSDDFPKLHEVLTEETMDSIKKFESMFPGLNILVSPCHLFTKEDINLGLITKDKKFVLPDEGE